ncbi:hypothetical protein [Mycobacterium sp. OTB74]|jgi:hypothetical protein|uniref:hypothetical protein n=1 Tax=Mycobacterium sp. OTB74 TaxID=1853452 RepID=UPI002476F510|nr:hypothetical protein [Mycobacterium sp. OTB74]
MVHITGDPAGTFDGNVDTSGARAVWRNSFAAVTTVLRIVWTVGGVDGAGTVDVAVVADADTAAAADTGFGETAAVDTVVAVGRTMAWLDPALTAGSGGLILVNAWITLAAAWVDVPPTPDERFEPWAADAAATERVRSLCAGFGASVVVAVVFDSGVAVFVLFLGAGASFPKPLRDGCLSAGDPLIDELAELVDVVPDAAEEGSA